jgi:hypothetical protein
LGNLSVAPKFEELTESYVKGSPCRANIIRDNCFSHNPYRAEVLLKRTFNQTIIENTKEVLEHLRNQTVLLVGDSLSAGIFWTIVCHFSQFSPTTYDFSWRVGKSAFSDATDNTTCPGNPFCALVGGESYFEKYNLRMRFETLYTYGSRGRWFVESTLTAVFPLPTIVFWNFGMHYNDKGSFVKAVQEFRGELFRLTVQFKNDGIRFPTLYWIETVPQHFTNGYFEHGISDHKQSQFIGNNVYADLECSPIFNKLKYFEEDYRNRQFDVLMPEFVHNRQIVRIAKSLYNQYDAHVDYGDSLRDVGPDCTHYCVGSGIYRHILNEVFKKLISCLGHNCPKTELAVPSLRL